MKKLILAFLLLSTVCAAAQTAVYTTANAHAHNDYQHGYPLTSAYSNKYGSIEADIFLSDTELLVAHTERDISNNVRLEDVYIIPLLQYIQSNKGYVYEDTAQTLIMMFDVKSEAVPTLKSLIKLLSKYPEITQCKSLKILVSGNRPKPSTYVSYPSYIWFDGLLSLNYKTEELSRIAILSDNFINYTNWKGNGNPPRKSWEALQSAVSKGHALGKKVRLWNTPDFIEGWQKVCELGVDYIDTYSIKSFAEFLKQNKPPKIAR